ncbi:TIGR03086 family metal-binding protein [Saccharomonospora sp. NPDC046836]|uniref:TIGR03086 family metal-binding protein n=1 Tax=Saccharomonospora sp. NPDC046836 TaxID=3156921 RepID=UPI0034024694
MTGDWRQRLLGQIGDLTDALGTADAWQGTTRMSAGDVPAAMIGQMVLCELVIHGWDLAKATGQEFHCDAQVAAALTEIMRHLGEQGRQMKVFGPAVPIAESAGELEQVLALSGRDPAWAPAA